MSEKRKLWMQCPGCWGAAMCEDPRPDGYIECECGETRTVIDLRDALDHSINVDRGALASAPQPRPYAISSRDPGRGESPQGVVLGESDRERLEEMAAEKEFYAPKDAAFLRSLASHQPDSKQRYSLEEIRELLTSKAVIDKVAEERAIEELYGHWNDGIDFPGREANQKRRYAQLAKKPGVQESWKKGAEREANRLLAAAFEAIDSEEGPSNE